MTNTKYYRYDICTCKVSKECCVVPRELSGIRWQGIVEQNKVYGPCSRDDEQEAQVESGLEDNSIAVRTSHIVHLAEVVQHVHQLLQLRPTELEQQCLKPLLLYTHPYDKRRPTAEPHLVRPRV